MDETIWEASKRGFPFNVSHKSIVMLALGIPTFAALLLIDYKNTYLWTIIGLITIVSVFAYQITEKVIM